MAVFSICVWVMIPALWRFSLGDVLYERVHGALTSLPPDVPLNVTHLRLDYNSICALGAVASYTQLEELDIADNCLAAFPDLCAVNATLAEVDVSSNQIAAVDAGRLRCLAGLLELNLADNLLTGLPAVTLHVLYELKIYSNDFAVLPPLHIIAPALEEAGLSGNPLSLETVGIPGELLHLGASLRYVTLGGMHIRHIDPERVAQLRILRGLKLAINDLPAIPELGPCTTTLRTLDVSENPISTVNPAHIRRFTALQTLKLGGCMIKLGHGLTIDLSGNPLACDCSSRELKLAVLLGVVTVSSTTCSRPTELVGMNVADVAMDMFSCSAEDTYLEFRMYRVDVDDFTCSAPTANITTATSGSLTACALHCVHTPGCVVYRRDAARLLCHTYTFGANTHDAVAFTGDLYMVN